MPALIAGAAIGVGTLIYSGVKEAQAKKAQAAALANRPKYQIPNSENDIQNLAESQANQGMGAAARQSLQNNTDRALATGANAINMGGGDANAVGNLVEKSQEGSNQNAIYDDQARLSNLSNLQSAYTRASANSDKAWNLNQYQPWANQQAALSQQTQYYQNMFGKQLGSLGSSVAGLAGGLGGGGDSGGAGGSLGGGGYISSTPTDGPGLMPTPQSQSGSMQTSSMSNWGIG